MLVINIIDQIDIVERGNLLYDESQDAKEEFLKWKHDQIIFLSIFNGLLLMVSLIVIVLIIFSLSILATCALVGILIILNISLRDIFRVRRAQTLKVYTQGIEFMMEFTFLFSKTHGYNFEQYNRIKNVFVSKKKGDMITVFRTDGKRIHYIVLDKTRFVNVVKDYISFVHEYHEDYNWF